MSAVALSNPPHLSRAAPRTLDTATRTVEVVAATSAPVDMGTRPRPDGSLGPWREQLDFSAADWSRFAIAPVLLRHHSNSVQDQVGAVESFAVRGETLIATLKFSEREAAAIVFNDIAAGILRGVSIGYVVMEYRRGPETGDEPPIFIATKWQPYEITLVAIPADPATGVRAFTSPEKPTVTNVINPRETFAPIIEAARALLSDATVNALHERAIAEDWTPETLRSRMFDTLIADTPRQVAPAAPVAHDHRGPTVAAREAMAEALAHRVIGGALEGQAREYAGWRIPDMARELLRASGDPMGRGAAVGSNAPARIVERAMHTTSDFPLLLGAASNRVALAGYERAEAAIKAIARMRPEVPDFRTINTIRIAGMNRLERVPEAGEVKAGTAFETGESYKVSTYAKLFNMSREAMVNDDLGALDAVNVMGSAAAETEAAELVAALAANGNAGPTMKDGQPLFRTAAGNLVATGTALDVTSLGAAIAMMRVQKDVGGNLVTVAPSILLVGPALELIARQALAAVQAAKVADTNPYSGAFTLVVEPRIAGNAWYLFGDPDRTPVIEMAYLAGSNGQPKTETFTRPEYLGVTFRVVHDFGIGAVGRVGAVRNPGA